MAVSQPDSELGPIFETPKADVVPGALSYSVDARWIKNSTGLRFDASHYNPRLARALATLRGSGLELRPLGEVCERVFIPPRFKRVYVSEKHGIPFLQGSHLVHSEPADLKYLSAKAHIRLDRWIIHRGWVLVTCSGTIGRVAVARGQWDGWAASQHILRIIPASDGVVPAGYLYAFLRSFAGQAQLTSRIYGAVVDEITEEQAESILVPVATTAGQRKAVEAINDASLEAVRLQERSVDMNTEAFGKVAKLLGSDD
jgi:type I restriction enzyme, S subunit